MSVKKIKFRMARVTDRQNLAMPTKSCQSVIFVPSSVTGPSEI
jgi:hypothetical protein